MGGIEQFSLREILDHIADDCVILMNDRLSGLTSLGPTGMEMLSAVWKGIRPERKRRIISRLVELAEDNVEMDFDSIFKNGLSDGDEEVRRQSIEGLWENEESTLVSPLIELLMNDTAERVRSAAAIALGKYVLLSEKSRHPRPFADRLRKALLETIENKSQPSEVRRRALEAAAPLNTPEVKEAIKKAYVSTDLVIKASSIYAMGKSLNTEWLPVLLAELESPDPEIRYEACGACGEMEAASAVPKLVKRTEDEDSDVRLAAISALGNIGTAEAKLCLQQCMESNNEAVRQAAEHALNEISANNNPLAVEL